MNSAVISSNLDVLGGTPVLAGTRVPVRVLFEHVEAGDPLDVFGRLSIGQSSLRVQVLEDARKALLADANPA